MFCKVYEIQTTLNTCSFYPFHSQKWFKYNFSLQCQYILKQTGDENKDNYQLGILPWSSGTDRVMSVIFLRGGLAILCARILFFTIFSGKVFFCSFLF